MSCALTSGFTLNPCNDTIGGVKSIYIGDFSGLTIVTSGSGTVASPTLIATGSSGTVFEYQPLKNSASATFTPVVSVENGTVFFQTTVTFNMRNINGEKREELALLSKAKVMLIVEMNTGGSIMFGTEQGMYLTAGTITTGAAFGDLQGYTLTFTSDETIQPIPLASTVAATFTVGSTEVQ